MSLNVAHDLRTKSRTGDVLLSENVDFAGLLLSDHVLAGLSRSGFKKPSPIQLKAIPIGRCGLDLIVQAKSGTGKTVVFSTIALESLQLKSSSTQVLVMAPTREIAVQIWEVMKSISSEMSGVQCQMFIGGFPVNQDKQKLKHCHVAIGTPGRIKQLIETDTLKTESIRLFILDEADKLLEESFQEQINWIYSTLPDNKQMLALSATYPEYMAQQLTVYMRNPTFVRLNSNDPALLGIKQYFQTVPFHPFPHTVFENKVKVLIKLLSSVSFHQCLVFSNLQTRAQSLCDMLNDKGWPSVCIAGCLEQQKRLMAMEKLKTFKCRVLISTDLTSRGIDAENVNLVVNLDLPHDHETYLHRIGRAGRFGSFGASVILISGAEEGDRLKTVENKCNTCIHQLPDPIPADLADRDLPVSLGELVTTTKIITRHEDDRPVGLAKMCEEFLAGDVTPLQDNGSDVPVASELASTVNNMVKGDTDANQVKGEKQVPTTTTTTKESGLDALAEGKDRKAETTKDDITIVKADSSTGENKMDKVDSNNKMHWTGDKTKEVRRQEGEKTTVVVSSVAAECTDEVKSQQWPIGKDAKSSKKTRQKKNKTSNAILREGFGGGESFEICNTDIVILERPGCGKLPNTPPISQVTPCDIPGDIFHQSNESSRSNRHVFSANQTHHSECHPDKGQSTLDSVPSTRQTDQAVEKQTDKNSLLKDTWNQLQTVTPKAERVNENNVQIKGRKKIVAVRRRRVGTVMASSAQSENNCDNVPSFESHHYEKSTSTVLSADQTADISGQPKNHLPSVPPTNGTGTITHRMVAPPCKTFVSHTYSSALEDYEQFLQSWDETSQQAVKEDWMELLKQKCNSSKNVQKCNMISKGVVTRVWTESKCGFRFPQHSSNVACENCVTEGDNLSSRMMGLALNCGQEVQGRARSIQCQTDTVVSPEFFGLGTSTQNPEFIKENPAFRDSSRSTSSVTMPAEPSEQNPHWKPFQHSQLDTSTSSESKHRHNVSEKISKIVAPRDVEFQHATQDSCRCETSYSSAGYRNNSAISDSKVEAVHASSSSTVSSSSSSCSTSSFESNSESESESSDDESQNEDPINSTRKKSYTDCSTEELLEGERCLFKDLREPRYPKQHHSRMDHLYQESNDAEGSVWQTYYPYSYAYQPQWGYHPRYGYGAYYNLHRQPTHTYYQQHHRNPQRYDSATLMDSYVNKTDTGKMKKILKCQFDYLKYMKTHLSHH